MVFLVRERVFSPMASRDPRLSPHDVVSPRFDEGFSSSGIDVSRFSLVDVSVTKVIFLQDKGANVPLNPNLEDQWVTLYLASILQHVQLGCS